MSEEMVPEISEVNDLVNLDMNQLIISEDQETGYGMSNGESEIIQTETNYCENEVEVAAMRGPTTSNNH